MNGFGGEKRLWFLVFSSGRWKDRWMPEADDLELLLFGVVGGTMCTSNQLTEKGRKSTEVVVYPQ